MDYEAAVRKCSKKSSGSRPLLLIEGSSAIQAHDVLVKTWDSIGFSGTDFILVG